ncbi:MAG: glycosyltransferase family 39 protein [Alphaproteobacteria bacterium]|nr:glycosyltransferase family 39 protein [Alphaproteobacteria bacterium]
MSVSRSALLLGLILVLVLGAGLRLYGLDARSFWNDELSIATDTAGSLAGLLAAFTEGRQAHPPLYGLLIWGWVQCFGDSEWSLRLPSAIAGILTIPLVFLLGRRLYGVPEGLVAALLVAVAKTGLRFSQEVRPYGLLMLLGVLTSWLLVEVLTRETGSARRRGFAAAYVAAAVALAYLHYFGALTLFAQGVTAALWAGRQRRRWLEVGCLFGIILAAFLPWLGVVFSHIGRGSWIRPTDARELGNYALMIIGGGTASGLVFAAALAVGSLRLRPLAHFQRGTWFLLILFILPLALALVISAALTPIFVDRNLIATGPIAALILARMLCLGLGLDLGSRKWVATVAVAFAALTLVESIFLWRYYGTPKTQFREVAAAVRTGYADSETTALILCAGEDKLEYYFRQFGFSPRIDAYACRLQDLKETGWAGRRPAPATELLLAVARRDVDPALIEFFRQQFHGFECNGFKKATLYRFTRPGRQTVTGSPPLCAPHATAVGQPPFIAWWETVRPVFLR